MGSINLGLQESTEIEPLSNQTRVLCTNLNYFYKYMVRIPNLQSHLNPKGLGVANRANLDLLGKSNV